MKLLFDQNLSPRLVELLADAFADSLHVRTVGLGRADDDAMWQFHQHALRIAALESDPDTRFLILL